MKATLISLITNICFSFTNKLILPVRSYGFSYYPTGYSSNNYFDQISMPDAWEITTGKANHKIGIIDSGIYNHSVLSNNLNQTINGCFTNYSTTCFTDEEGHGTVMAGIVGSIGSSTICPGVNLNADICSLKAVRQYPVMNSDSYRYLEDREYFADAINYASNNNIDICNFSGGFLTGNSTIMNAIDSYQGLLVCSAGNIGSNGLETFNSNSNVFPACYNYDNLISVGGVNNSNYHYSSGVYSSNLPDVMAPYAVYNVPSSGGGVVSSAEGTSCSAAIVTGICSLVKSVNPLLTASEIKNIIISTVDEYSWLAEYCESSGVVNAYKAVKKAIPRFSQVGNAGMSSLENIGIGESQWFKFYGNGLYNFYSTSNLDLKIELFTEPKPENLVYTSSNSSGNL